MSDYAVRKALHLLHVHGQPDAEGRPALPLPALQAAGIDCYGDTLFPLLDAGVIVRVADGRFALSPAGSAVIAHCCVGNKRWASGDVKVDQPRPGGRRSQMIGSQYLCQAAAQRARGKSTGI